MRQFHSLGFRRDSRRRSGSTICLLVLSLLTWAAPSKTEDAPMLQEPTHFGERNPTADANLGPDAAGNVGETAAGEKKNFTAKSGEIPELNAWAAGGQENSDTEESATEQQAPQDGDWPVRVVPVMPSRGSKIEKIASLTTDRIRDIVLLKEIAKNNSFVIRDPSEVSPTKRARWTGNGSVICETAPWKASATVASKRQSVSIVRGNAVSATHIGVEYEPRPTQDDRLPVEVPLVPNPNFQGRRAPVQEGSRGAFFCRDVGSALMFIPSPVDLIPEFAAGPWSVAVGITIVPNPLRRFSSEVRLRVIDNISVIENLDDQSFALPDALKTPNDVAMFSLAADQCRAGDYCTLERGRESWGKGSDVKLSCNIWNKRKVSKRVVGATLGLAKGLALTAGIAFLASRLRARGQRRNGEEEETVLQGLKNAKTATKATLLAALILGGVGLISAAVAGGLKTKAKKRAVRKAIEPTLESLVPWIILDPTKAPTTSIVSDAEKFNHFILQQGEIITRAPNNQDGLES